MEKIWEKVRHGKVIRSDETSASIHGLDWWQWAFVGKKSEYHLMMPSRGCDAIERFMRDYEAEAWVCDYRKPQVDRAYENMSDLFSGPDPQLARLD